MDRKLRIGITERGDAGLDLSWTHRLSAMDGAILITKNLNDRFRQALPDKDVDIVLTHEEAQRIADQLFGWL